MAQQKYDVAGIGNAIVDVLAHADDAFLTENAVEKGAMTLIDAERAANLYARMAPSVEISGGSAANTIAGVASFGARAAFIGKVRDDQLGEIFSHDIRATGVAFETPPLTDGPPTARCLILVTPDAQRSMNTFLGAATELSPADVSEELIGAAGVTYLEGYLFDRPHAKDAFYKAAELSHKADRKVSLTLSDSFCVDRHRDDFLSLVEKEVDILFANEAEILSLFQVSNFDEAVKIVQEKCEVAALTRSEKGSTIVTAKEVVQVDAAPVPQVVDTTGAGDLYASGFLYGFSRGYDMKRCGQLASLAAAEVISHFGARPETPLKELAEKKGLAA